MSTQNISVWRSTSRTNRTHGIGNPRSRSAAGRASMEFLERRLLLATDVLTWHYDNTRQGANTAETALTTANVNASTFGKLFTLPADGYVYAQPLLRTGVNVVGYGVRDVLIVATEHDSVYAFDAYGNNPAQGYLWRTNFLTGPAGTTVTTVPNGDIGTTDIVPEIGITGTPVIDPATNTLYVVAKTKETTGGVVSYVQRLHVLDLTTGFDKPGAPIVISASVPGTGDGGSTINFDPRWQNQRAALALANGILYIGWGSHGDNNTYHGWVIAYNASTFAQVGAFCSTPNGGQAGVWQAAGGISIDSSGNVYFSTGNGTFTANTGGKDYGDSTLKMTGTLGSVLSYFTPYNEASLNTTDMDYGASAAIVLPDQSGAVTHELITAGKLETVYLLNRDSLGGYSSVANNDVSEHSFTGLTFHNSLAYFNGHVYAFPDGGHGTALPIVNSLFASPDSQTADTYGASDANGAGSTPSVSANGTTNGIVWASNNTAYGSSGPAILRAYSAANLAALLWASNASGSRDTALPAVKFTTPMVANGRVYLGGQTGITVWGLLGTVIPAAPTNVAAQASGTQINVAWTAPAGVVTSYNLYRSMTPGGEGATPYRTGITATSFLDSGLAPTTTYYYTVAAVNGAGTSPQSAEASATTQTAPAVTQAPLSSYYNQIGIYNDGVTFSSGGLDGQGNALSGNLLTSSLTWNGNPFAIGPAGANDVVHGGAGVVITLPSGNYSNLLFVATGTNGNQPSQSFVVTYADNTTTTFTQGVSDWFTPQSYTGESTALSMNHRNVSNGTADIRTFLVYGYNLALNSSKTLRSITLPNNVNVRLLAIDLLAVTATIPQPPTALAANAASSGEIDLTWTAPAGPVSSYNVFRSTTPGGEGTTPLATGITTTSFADTTVAASTTYYYTVQAVNSAGPSAQSTEAFATTPAPSATTQVALGSYFNLAGIYNDGVTFVGGIDGSGNALSGNLVEPGKSWNGNAFVFGPANALNDVRGGSGVVINLPAVQSSSLQFLGLATHGSFTGLSFTVTYTDNTTQTFTRSMSDWHTPQSYAGESIALTMPYRDVSNGTTDNRTFYIYGYSLALNSAKTVRSITLPNNTNIHVLAMDLVAAGPVVIPDAPTGLSAQAISNSQINLTWNAPPQGASSYSLYRGATPGGEGATPYRTGITSTSFPDTGLPASTTYYYKVVAVNSAGASPQSAEASATTAAASTAVQVSLASYFNRIGITADGVVFTSGGFDNIGHALSGTLMGSSITWNGALFNIAPAGVNDVVHGGSGIVITLPAGQFSALRFLAAGVNGNQPSQSFLVTYTDSTTATFTQGISDWHTPQSYAGESQALTMAYRNVDNGTKDNRSFWIYGYSLALDPTKTIRSVTMPNNTNVELLAIDLVP